MTAISTGKRRNIAWFLFWVLVIFLLRSLITFPIEHHDATLKVYAAANIARTWDWSWLLWDHHTMRWSEMVPQVVITRLMRLRYEAVYVLPLLVFSLYVALIINALKDQMPLRHSVLLFVLLFAEPLALLHNGQLMNPPFGVLFSIAGIVALLKYREDSKPGVMFAAFLFFCAYGAHVTYLSFAGGAFLWLLWVKRQPAAAAIFTATLLGFFAVEILAFNLLSEGELTFGRLEALSQGKHIAWVETRFHAVEPQHLFARWLRIPIYDQLMALGFLLCVLWVALRTRARAATPDFVKLALLCGGCFALALTFAVLDLRPLRPLMPLLPMYLQPFFPYAMIGMVFLISRLETHVDRRVLLPVEAVAAVLFGLTIFYFVTNKGPLGDTLNNRLNAFMWKAEAELSDYAGRFASGELILRGRNRLSLSFVARYRHPVDLVQNHKTLSTSVANPSPDALCLTHIRKIPLPRNYQDCKTITWPAR